MILQKKLTASGLLTAIKFRKAGQMEKDGKLLTWDDAVQIILLPFEEEKNIRKYTVEPSCVEAIHQKLKPIHWGCFVEADISNNKVMDITIIEDVLKHFYENH